jgi:DNA invertase Pin-like site-specific DNA recombinase
LTEEAKEKAETVKKMYLSKEPEYSVREIGKALNVSLRTLYKYLDYTGVKKKGGVI